MSKKNFAEREAEKIADLTAKREKRCAEIQEKIEELESELFSIPDDLLFNTSSSVLAELVDIAKNGRSDNWTGFDDADIKWYLHEFNIDAPQHNDLRNTYNESIEQGREYRKQGKCVLFYFPIKQDEAKKLVAEVNAAKGMI